MTGARARHGGLRGDGQSRNVLPSALSVDSRPVALRTRLSKLVGVSGLPLDHWELWFPARPGPMRTKTRAGIKVKVQRLELPPTMNDRLHHHAKARWVKEWRSAAYLMAKHRGLPRLERVRVSMIIYRPRIGVADPDNDWGRAKPLIDGLREAGALAKDTHKHVTIGSIEERRGDHGILLVVDELEHVDPSPSAGREG